MRALCCPKMSVQTPRADQLRAQALPCAIHEKQGGLNDVSEQSPGDVAAVLVVDDDAAEVDLLKTVIEAHGAYEVTAVTDGDGGEALIVSQEWVFAIVELVLPGKDGVEVIQAGRKKHPDLPIMFVNASSNPALIDAAFRAGANHQLTSPIDPQEVLTQILGYSSTVDLESVPTVVAVGARPGDLEMGCGGILSRHRSEGHRIAVVNLAGGGDPHSDLARSARLAAGLLDATILNMGDEIYRIPDLAEAMDALKEVLQTSSVRMLYIPTASTDQPSSVQIHKLALGLAGAAPNVLAYQSPQSTVDFRPGLFVDVAPQMTKKLELVALYEKFDFKNVSTESAKVTAGFWGRFADPDLVEPLEIIRRGTD